MIPAMRAFSAVYRTKNNRFVHRPVIAWDDNGVPLVAGKRRLVEASDLGIQDNIGLFTGIVEAQEVVVAAVPGGGWLIDCTGEDGDTWTEPIVSWVVRADGTATPITTDDHGLTDEATSGLASYRIYHPGVPAPRSAADAQQVEEASGGTA